MSTYTEEDINNAFTNIQEQLSRNCKPSQEPKVFIFGGQPGAGKSLAMKRTINEGVVIINGDEYRELHPNADTLKRNPETFPEKTQQFSNELSDKLVKHCYDNQLSFAVEGTMRNPEVCLKTMQQAKDAGKGYKVSAHIVTCQPQQSWQSCIDRYTDMKERTGFGRMVDKNIHDQAVHALPNTATAILKSGLADELSIHDRSGCLFTGHNSKDATNARRAIRDAQRSPELQKQVNKFRAKVDHEKANDQGREK